MDKAIRFRAAITVLFGSIGMALVILTVYIFREDKNHSSINGLMFLTLLSLFFTVGHMAALFTMIRRKQRVEQ
ncbi:hypothetical protein [Paenibacillus sp. GCM10028914]|uniref:hypothetical protein n=1 Tax=Paenibacillus sp. GCM10028914 TaxID=3273416 RepID=UPI00361B6613